jgi:hypothetical protein
LTLKTKAKPSGLPDSNFIFFVATKKTKAKENLALRWACVRMARPYFGMTRRDD